MSLIKREFTTDWFDRAAKPVWNKMLPRFNLKRILEIGSFEGASACYLVDMLKDGKGGEIHCVDTWTGGVEHLPGGQAPADMSDVKRTFERNTALAIAAAGAHVELIVHVGTSASVLSGLVDSKAEYFDMIYIDGSHQAPDVLCDAVLSYLLLKKGGLLIFDDYLWSEQLQSGVDPIRSPKIAIDAFTTINCRKMKLLSAPLYQVFLQKLS